MPRPAAASLRTFPLLWQLSSCAFGYDLLPLPNADGGSSDGGVARIAALGGGSSDAAAGGSSLDAGPGGGSGGAAGSPADADVAGFGGSSTDAGSGGTSGDAGAGGSGGGTLVTCGNGVRNVSAGEACDDAGESASCDDDCTAAACGDGVTKASAGEACDDAGNSASCDSDCTAAACGDGVLNTSAGETCDDGGESSTCNADCSAATCGDGVVNAAAGEECEPSLDPECTSRCNYVIHRFSFNESGTTLVDSVGSASGTVYGTSLTGNGSFSMNGSGQYAALSGVSMASLVNATVEVWVTWSGSDPWERVFDFGAQDPVPPDQTQARHYFAMTPMNDLGVARVALSDGPAEADDVVLLSGPLPSSKRHVAVVVDDDADVLQVYVNGVFRAQTALTVSLSILDDETSWLGRSQYSHDPYFRGAIHELRIYGTALSAAQVLDSYNAGEDP